jgi:mono/diheme cytochrome c family protein
MFKRLALPSMLAAMLLTSAATFAQVVAQVDIDHGKAVFFNRCAICHGMNADGHSNLAKIMRPPPANLRASKLDEQERARIIRSGGAAVGRSANMPEWQIELTEEELRDVLAFVGTLREHSP